MNDGNYVGGHPEIKINYFLKDPAIMPEAYSKFLADSISSIAEVCNFYYPSRGLKLISRHKPNDELHDIALKLSFSGVLKFPEVLVSKDDSGEVYQRRYDHLYRAKPVPLQGYEPGLAEITNNLSRELDKRYPMREGKLIVSNLPRTEQSSQANAPYDLEFTLHIETVKETKIDIELSRGNIIYMHGKSKSEGIALPMIGLHVSSTLENEEIIEHIEAAVQDVIEGAYETSVVLESSQNIWISGEEIVSESEERRIIN
jgi:hypothetical protein